MPTPTPIPTFASLLNPEFVAKAVDEAGLNDCVEVKIEEVGEELVMTVEAKTEDDEVVMLVGAKDEDGNDEAVAAVEAESESTILNLPLENEGDVLPGINITKKKTLFEMSVLSSTAG
ncbi:hypothetical protein MMC29_000744 [Sticta canariensis]|nr:hypothetical protein [Sticta canariensis]